MPRQQPPLQLRDEAARIHHRADVADRQEVDERDHAGLDVHFDLGEAGDEAVGVAVARIGVLGHAHQAEAGEPRRRRLRERVDVVGQLVAVEAAAERDGARRRLRVA